MGLIDRWREARARRAAETARIEQVLRDPSDEVDAAFEDWRAVCEDQAAADLEAADEIYLTEQWMRIHRRLARDWRLRLRAWVITRFTRPT